MWEPAARALPPSRASIRSIPAEPSIGSCAIANTALNSPRIVSASAEQRDAATGPMRSMLREPRLDDHTTYTAVTPDFVFTVRTYGTGPFYESSLVRKSAFRKPGTSRSARRD
jgi:hypothetical protein